MPHVQLSPDAAVGTSPDGGVSVMVIRLVVEPEPMLLGVSVNELLPPGAKPPVWLLLRVRLGRN